MTWAFKNVYCMSFLRGSSESEGSPSSYSNATVRRAFMAWLHSRRHNSFKSVCEFYHRLEQIEESLPEECRAASRTFEIKHFAYDPNPSQYFANLFELDRVNKLQISQDPIDHLELFKNAPISSDEYIDPETYDGYRQPVFVELTRRFAAEQALLRAAHEARVAAANSLHADSFAQTSNMHLHNGYPQGETQHVQCTAQSAVSAESSTHASRPSVYAQGAGSYAQTGAVYSQAVGGYPSSSTSYCKRDGTNRNGPTLHPQGAGASTLGVGFPEKMYGVPTQSILATSRLLLTYCRSHKITLNKFLEGFKAFVERGDLRYSVANLDFYIKQRLIAEELVMVDNFTKSYAYLKLDDEDEIELERQRVSAFFGKRRAMKNYTILKRPTQNGDAENTSAVNGDAECVRINCTRELWTDKKENYAEVTKKSSA